MTFDDLFDLVASDDEWAAATVWTAPGTPSTDERRLFGGVLIGQAIAAASSGSKTCHSLHVVFLSAGDKAMPFEVAVERTRDGRSFATRRVEIRQGERLLLAGHTSHHGGDAGPDRQVTAPNVPLPEQLEDQRVTRARAAEARGQAMRRYLAEDLLDVRPVEIPVGSTGGPRPVRAVWVRPRTSIVGSAIIHRAAIGFASDLGLVHAGLVEHGRSGGGRLQTASLDHSLWFHRDVCANDWLLYVHYSPTSAGGRGLSRAEVFSTDGRLVASAAQEFLARSLRE